MIWFDVARDVRGGFNCNHFNAVKGQCGAFTKYGVRDISHNGNYFYDCIIWDWFLADDPNPYTCIIRDDSWETYICSPFKRILDNGANTVYFEYRCNDSDGDIEPPSMVTGLAVSDAKDGKLNLAWNAATDNVGVDHYNIYRNGGFLTEVKRGYAELSFADGGEILLLTFLKPQPDKFSEQSHNLRLF